MEETSVICEEDCFRSALEMEANEEISNDDLTRGEDEISPLDIEENDQVIVEADDSEVEGDESSKVVVKTSYEAKLRELLRDINSLEIKIFSEASKEFIRLLRGNAGGEMLHQYVQASPLCLELAEAWKLRQGKPGMAHVVSLISVILDHPDGKYKSDDLGRITISRRLDKFARSIIETKLEDVYKELNSKEAKRQNAALSVMSAVVRRGVGLASEVAKIFDFKLPLFPKLAEYQQKKTGKKGKHSTRRTFIDFAMSFLEIGNPRLLRWVLQQKDMYSGILRGLGSDDEETVVYVLSTLRDRVLTPGSLVPPGLRSVLFGSVTLDQLVSISGNPIGGPAAVMAHEVLIRVCTDPRNGLMPDFKAHTNPLKGNRKRLLDLMKKLKATEIDYHRDLILAIVNGSPSLGSAYMDEFPYILEPRSSPIWFSAISLAADLVSSAGTSLPFDSIASQSQDLPSLDSLEVQCMLKCIVPRAFSRMVINRGLLHSDILVKHASLKYLLEALKSLDCLIGAINSNSCSSNPMMQKWVSLKQEIQDEARALLPDPQVLLKLVSSLSYSHSKNLETSLKRARNSENLLEIHSGDGVKKLKTDLVNDDSDIVVMGISAQSDTALTGDSGKVPGTFIMEELNNEKGHLKVIAGIWGLHKCSMLGNELKDVEILFHSKLLDALAFYLRTMPTGLEGSFDFFKILPSNPLALSISLQQSLLSLLIEHIGWSPRSRVCTRTPESMYKHLQPFINLLMFSPVKGIKDQAYVLARAAMSSTGAFDRNLLEIDAWFLFLPGYSRDKSSGENQEIEVFQNLSGVVLSFLCDAVSTIGNNLYKYLNLVRCHISNLTGVEEISPDFSPLIICVLQKCLRLLDSDSATFKLSEKSMISTYVCTTLSFLLQTQVQEGLLSALIDLVLTERLEDHCLVNNDSGNFLCEWRPLKNLLLFARSISHQQACSRMSSIGQKTTIEGSFSFIETLSEVKRMIRSANGGGLLGVATAFSSSIICTTSDEILENFPSVITVSWHLLGAPFSFLSSIFFLERDLLASVAKLWPDIFFSGLKMVGAMICSNFRKDDACLLTSDMINSSSAEETICSMDFDSIESASVAFSFFLKQVPFCALFPAIVSIGNSYLSDPTKLLDLLLAKLTEGSTDDSIVSLRLILFWVHQIQSSYRIKPLNKLEQLLEICFVLINHIVAQLLVVKPDFDSSTTIGSPFLTQYIHEVVETILHHPAVTVSLSHPLCCNEELTIGSFGDSLEEFLSLSKHSIHKMDHHILNLLTKVADYLLALCNGQILVSEVHDNANKRLLKMFKSLVQRLVLVFRGKYDLCIRTEDLMPLLPTFHGFYTFLRFISPFELLELVHWMFCEVGLNSSTGWNSSKSCALSVGFCIADGLFEMLSNYLHQSNTNTVPPDLLWEVEGRSFDLTLLEKIYYKLVEYATCFKLDRADLCLLKAVNAVYRLKRMQPRNALLQLSMVMSRVIMSSPVEMLSHCIHRTNKTKAKLLFLLTEVSPLHLSLFGQIFSSILKKDFLGRVNVMEYDCNNAFSDEDFMMLLPAALSYLNSNFVKFGKQYYKNFGSIPSFYSKILLNGFLNWKSYVSGNIFQEEYSDLLPSSTEELLNFVGDSLLGKSIQMLRYYFLVDGDSMRMKRRLELFDSIYPCFGAHDELLDCDVNEINVSSIKLSLNFINRVIAKISFSRMLLFPEDNLIQSPPTEKDRDFKDMPSQMESDREDLLKLRFMNILVSIWHKVVKKFPSVTENSEKSKNMDCSLLFKFLEAFILRSILELSTEMQGGLRQLHSLPFMEQFTRLSLLHRFEDPTTLNALRIVLTSLSEGNFSCGVVFELLLAHSQFVPTILWSDSISESSGLSQSGTFLKPISSILKLLFIPCSDQSALDVKNILDTSALYKKKLEVVKLLRVLYRLKARQCNIDSGKDVSMDSRELLSLLLSCYGATLSEIDLEIFDLMHEIESTEGSDCGNISEMDYLWGNSALKIRKEQALEKFLSFKNITDCETVEERRRRQFRENLPIDSRLCVTTVLYFPFDRIAGWGPTTSRKLHQDNFMDMVEINSASNERIQRYDPAFILRFSIHSLSMGYIEPTEFAGLGLLAIVFVSISSPDEGIRKLGYEALGRFKNALENCRNRKDGLRLRLLLTYVQNGIEEPWQKIPSVIAIFAAEASFILLDPSHDHYSTISKLLMRSPRVNLKCIPLFHTLFGSSSVNFKTDRLWILRLSFAGLNLDDDAQIYTRKFVLEIILSFYASSLSDYESKLLILQIVKKSVKLHMLARYLVEHCGLISWLSSVLSFCSERLCGDHKSLLHTQLTMVLEVVKDVISFRNIIEWLQKYALEQLSELSYHLHKLLVAGGKLVKQNVALVDSILHILVSTLRISQKRKIYQPHFTLSVEGLVQLYQAINDGDSNTRSGLSAELGLKAILMSAPLTVICHMDGEIPLKFIMWAIPTALRSNSKQASYCTQMLLLKESHFHFTIFTEEEQCEDSLISKLLRWLTASVILGRISRKSSKLNTHFSLERSNMETLQSLLEHIKKEHGKDRESNYVNDEALAAMILYLQQLLGMTCRVLPSVVSALCLLLLPDASNSTGTKLYVGNHGSFVASQCSKIRCPVEANPSWRWSFYQPWKDLSSELTDLQKMDEHHACQTLLVIFSNALGGKSLDVPVLSHKDVEDSGVFTWERKILKTK